MYEGMGELERVTLNKHQLKALNAIPLSGLQMDRGNLNLSTWMDRITGAMFSELTATMLGEKDCEYVEKTIRYPANWIEALKERFLPAFLAKWLPVRYTCVDVVKVTKYRCCPHLLVPESGTHVNFLRPISEQSRIGAR